jgi:hypothetical protein
MNLQCWSLMFRAAAGFNFLIGVPVFFAPSWTYRLAYVGETSQSTLRFWGDFGFAVVLIGVGYWIVARDITKNRGIVWLGVFAKLFDVVALSWRWAQGIAQAIALLPAAIDGAFVILFILFLHTGIGVSTHHATEG